MLFLVLVLVIIFNTFSISFSYSIIPNVVTQYQITFSFGKGIPKQHYLELYCAWQRVVKTMYCTSTSGSKLFVISYLVRRE